MLADGERYTDSDGNECDLPTMCRREPGWAANRIAALLTERQRHAEEVAALRDQLRRVEEERDRLRRANETLAVRMDLTASQLLMVGSELCGDGKIDPNDHRDPRWTPTLQRAAEVMRELTASRALDADVMACADIAVLHGSEHGHTVLAADFLRGPCPECHMVERCFGGPIDESDKEPTP